MHFVARRLLVQKVHYCFPDQPHLQLSLLLSDLLRDQLPYSLFLICRVPLIIYSVFLSERDVIFSDILNLFLLTH